MSKIKYDDRVAEKINDIVTTGGQGLTTLGQVNLVAAQDILKGNEYVIRAYINVYLPRWRKKQETRPEELQKASLKIASQFENNTGNFYGKWNEYLSALICMFGPDGDELEMTWAELSKTMVMLGMVESADGRSLSASLRGLNKELPYLLGILGIEVLNWKGTFHIRTLPNYNASGWLNYMYEGEPIEPWEIEYLDRVDP